MTQSKSIRQLTKAKDSMLNHENKILMNIDKKFKGNVIPVVTPFTFEHKLDFDALERLFYHLTYHKASPFILGTTGESASLSVDIKNNYIQEAGKLKPANSLLYVGISSNSLEESVDMAKRSFDVGADAVAATLPTYYSLTNDQMKRYFFELADQIGGPMLIYNIPATTHMSIPLTLIDELSHHDHIVGTKDSERSTERLDRSLQLWSNRNDFSHFVGWAAQSAYGLLNGSDGLIPSTGNLAPEIYCKLAEAVENNDQEVAFYYQHQSDVLGNLYQSGRLLGQSLAALKALMQEVGLCNSAMMSPLQELTSQEAAILIEAFYELVEKEGIKLNKLNHVR
jgi:dihydrodipicolinate synthase/N-acetylneuraminate lyase